MTARLLGALIALWVATLLPTASWAQDARDLIRHVAKALVDGDSTILSDNVQRWAREEGTDAIGKLRGLAQINNVVGATDDVVQTTWLATGRAIHAGGASDWRIVFSGDAGKVVHVDLAITLIPDRLPELPAVRFRGNLPPHAAASPESLKPCVRYPALCASKEHGETDPRLVEFLFATTRQQISATTRISFSGERGPELIFGAARVRIPEDHRIGRIELPGNWLLNLVYESKPNPRKHFVIQDVKVLSLADWDAMVASMKADEALVFVHGYNTSFDDSVYRMAQIIWDLQYRGVAVLYSWASRGGTLSYAYDRDSALIDSVNFIKLLNMLKAEHGIKRVHVLAHSMGNFLIMDALKSQAGAANAVHVSELILAAPDVDGDYFKNNAPLVRTVADGMTLYASSADKALAVSRHIAGGIPRAGDVPTAGPIVLPQLDSIDVTAVGSDVLGLDHDTFADTRSVMTDIHALLSDVPRRLPNLRSIEIRGVPEGSVPPRYFRFTE